MIWNPACFLNSQWCPYCSAILLVALDVNIPNKFCLYMRGSCEYFGSITNYKDMKKTSLCSVSHFVQTVISIRVSSSVEKLASE